MLNNLDNDDTKHLTKSIEKGQTLLDIYQKDTLTDTDFEKVKKIIYKKCT